MYGSELPDAIGFETIMHYIIAELTLNVESVTLSLKVPLR
jgi:hypothetical protein